MPWNQSNGERDPWKADDRGPPDLFDLFRKLFGGLRRAGAPAAAAGVSAR